MSSTYNRHESKYFNTALLMNEALLKLLETKEYEYITVSEVCKTAGVNRSTFYLHYLGMDDLLKETIENKDKEFMQYFKSIQILEVDKAKKKDLIFIRPEFLVPYLNYIKRNKKLFLLAKSKPSIFIQKSSLGNMSFLFSILNKFDVPEKEKKYVISFFVSGVQAIVMEWVKNDCVDDIDYIAQFIITYVLGNKT